MGMPPSRELMIKLGTLIDWTRQLFPAVDRGDTASALALLTGPLDAANEAMGKPMDSLLPAEDAAAKAQSREARATYLQARTLLLGLLVGGAVVATGLGLVVTSSITRGVRRVQVVVDALARGDLTKAAGDSAKGAKYLGTAMQMARAARLESVLGFTKDAPPSTDGPERH